VETMTQLERFRAFLAREELDRPLRYANYTPGYRRPDFTAWYGPDVDPEQIDSLGVLRRKGTFYHFTHTESPLRNATSLRDIEEFPIETEADWPQDHMAAAVEDAHRDGYFVKGMVGHIYEDSWQIRGYEQFLTDLVSRPEWAECILDRITERNVHRAEAAARAGADVLHTGDDIANQKAMMFHPDLWRRVLKSRWARVYDAARRIKPDIAIWYHSDGNITDVIGDLIEIGVTILNPLQPECLDVDAICRQFGDRLLFDGAVGTQSTFPWGTPDEMRRVVRKRREVFGDRLMLSPTHVLEPEVPPENVVAFYEACDAAGTP